ILLDSLTKKPLAPFKTLLWGTGGNEATKFAHTLYTNIKIQGIYWLVYMIFFSKILFGKSKKFSKIDASRHGIHGRARWAHPKEIKQRFQQSDKGMVVGGINGKPCIQQLTSVNNNHSLILGGSGSGKTAGYSIPNILHISETLGDSFVVTDPKGDIYNATVPHLKRLGYEVVRVNLLDFLKSDGYNPLQYVNSGPEAITLVNTIMKNTGEAKNSDFWEKAERSLYAALILYLKETRPVEEQNLTNVLKLGLQIGKDNKFLDKLIETLPDDSEAKTFFNIFNLSEDKTRSGILVGFGVRLQLWAINEIKQLTASSDFRLGDLGKKKMALFILTRDEESTFDLITAIVVDQVFQELVKEARMSPNHRLPVSVRLILDEIANIAPINDLQKRVAVMRSRGVYINLIFQGLQQFKNRYGEGLTAEISDSCDNFIVLQANDSSTAVPVSKMLGSTTILTNSVSQSQNDRGSSNGMNYSMTGMELMRPEDVRNKDDRKLILIQKGQPPAFLDKYFFFEQKRWENLKQTNWADEPNKLFKPVVECIPNLVTPELQEEIKEVIEEEIEVVEETKIEEYEEVIEEKVEEKTKFDLFA
ncbi:VirD4-like conjugal transfer protein, CD1115 family, partial [Gottfriedia acidiceleris]|uniref:VirD4-like conjugal transfer protein, CD1115 family n=1 Tax=Gottfriedia acidiceleris TaxID=371036 RepID=UPI002FFF13CF